MEKFDDPSEMYEEPLDNLPTHDDEEPDRRAMDASQIYEEPIDNLSIYDDEEPDRPDVIPGAKTDDVEEAKLVELYTYEEPVDNLPAYDDEEPDDNSKCLKINPEINEIESERHFKGYLILDLEAAWCKPQSEKMMCKQKTACGCDSFPVTITEVTDLSADCLYVKWIIHDCCGIVGYEIYTDGCRTNRLYSSKHDSAVITNVDTARVHKIVLLAKAKTPPCESNALNDGKALCRPWKPSTYLYTPWSCQAKV